MADAAKNASQILFQNSLAEVVRKLRSSKRPESELIEECIAETRKEITSTVQSVKVMAAIKATYFSMLGYPATYGAFNIIEVMADSLFTNKRAGYVAACLTFTEDTEVVPLMTALLKRDMMSSNQYEVGLALYCLSCLCTPDLAKDLVTDVVNLLSHPRTYVRKKAALCLYKIFIQFPESLRPAYPKLKEKLEDDNERADNNPAVRSAIVCVLCEMARRNPVNFLGLAVPFFSMLSTVHNNWTLIKIVKVFGYFAPHEPRLGKKLVEPLTNIIMTTGAKSVQYECILAVANGMSRVSSITKLACEKMRLFVEDQDQNLKFLGLDAMAAIVKDNPKLLADQRDTIITCLDDTDSTIRRKALDVLKGIVSKKNVVSTINSMLDRCVRTPPDEDWSNTVIETIIETAQTEDYLYIQDFEWYCGILFDLCLINLSTFRHGNLLEKELVTVLTRVNGVRQYGVEALNQMLSNAFLLSCDPRSSNQWEVLKAAAFVCGEYPYWLPNTRETCQLLLSSHIAILPPDLQVICIAAVGKIAAFVHQPCTRHVELVDGEEELDRPVDDVTDEELLECILLKGNAESQLHRGLSIFIHSVYPDVQERANIVHYQITENPNIGRLFYEKELLPVAAGAQEAVEVPEGLDMDTPFCDNIPDLLPPSGHDDSDDDSSMEDSDVKDTLNQGIEAEKRKAKARMSKIDVFYIKDGVENADGGLFGSHRSDVRSEVPVETITAADLDLRDSSKRGKKVFAINRNLAKPTNYDDKAAKGKNTMAVEEDEATKRLRGIDVTRALTVDERLPEAVPYANLLKKALLSNPDGASKGRVTGDVAETLPSVLLYETRHARVVARVGAMRMKKDALRLPVLIDVHNVAASGSLHDVSVVVDVPAPEGLGELGGAASACVNQETAHLHTAVPVEADVDGATATKSAGRALKVVWNGVHVWFQGAGAEGDGLQVSVADRVKGGATGQIACYLCFSDYPTTFSSSTAAGGGFDIPMKISFKREKKVHQGVAPFPIRFEYFVKEHVPTDAPSGASVAPVTREIFNSKVLAVTLAHAPLLATFVPMSLKKKAQLSKVKAFATMRLTPMDYFEDAITLYAAVHTRKSSPDAGHVGVFLCSTTEGGEEGISIRAKSHNGALAELVLAQLSEQLLAQTSTAHVA